MKKKRAMTTAADTLLDVERKTNKALLKNVPSLRPAIHITEGKNNTYRADFYYTGADGTRKRKQLKGAATLQDLRARCMELAGNMATVVARDIENTKRGSDMLFQAGFEEYLANNSLQKEQTKTTIRNMAKKRLLPFFANTRIRDLTRAKVQEWQTQTLNEGGLKPSTLRRTKTILHQVCNYFVQMEYLSDNPVEHTMPFPKPPPPTRIFWTEQEFVQAMAALRNLTFKSEHTAGMYAVVFSTLYYTGMRAGELLALMPTDFDRTMHTLAINKTVIQLGGAKIGIQNEPKTQSSIRTIALPQALSDALAIYIEKHALADTEPIFYDFTSYELRRVLARAATAANVPVLRLHDLRHSHISLLINKGVDIASVTKRVGHAHPTTTLNIYTHATPNSDATLAELFSHSVTNALPENQLV